MNSPIAFRGFDPDEYRQRIRTLPDDELIKEGKMRWLSGDGKIVSTTPCAFDEQLNNWPGGISAKASKVTHGS